MLYYIIIITIIFTVYTVFDLILFILFIENKINTPSYLPDYIRRYFLNKQELASINEETIRIILNMEIKNMLVYIVTLFILVITYLTIK